MYGIDRWYCWWCETIISVCMTLGFYVSVGMCVLLNNMDFVYQVIKWTQHGDWGERISRLFRSIIAAYIY